MFLTELKEDTPMTDIKMRAEATGKCGDGLTWWQAGGDLYIEGQGEIEEEAFLADQSVQNIKIAPGCTGIGARAFLACTLESVELPDGLDHIDSEAFYAAQLPSLTVPDSVTEIGENAFWDISEIIYNGLALPEKNDNWGASQWTYDPVLRFRRALRTLHNDTNPKETSEDADITVYRDGVEWNGQTPEAGIEMDIEVAPPFRSTVGSTFHAICNKRRIVQAKLLSVLDLYEKSAKVRVLILQNKGYWSYVKPVSEETKADLLRNRTYSKILMPGICIDFWQREILPNLIPLCSIYGYDFDNVDIYTDPDGIDHAIWLENCELQDGLYISDRVLGLQADSPIQWENHLLIEWHEEQLLACRRDAKEVVVPNGIVNLGHATFLKCHELEQITIPDSVRHVNNAFVGNLKNLKRIILTGDSQLTEKDLPENVAIIRRP